MFSHIFWVAMAIYANIQNIMLDDKIYATKECSIRLLNKPWIMQNNAICMEWEK